MDCLVLEEANYHAKIRGWYFLAGANFVLEMHQALKEAPEPWRSLPDYLNSHFCQAGLGCRFGQRSRGMEMLVGACSRKGLSERGIAEGIISIDLVGKDNN
ncbi:MAG TPA: hypothetical protein VHY56_06960 [Candidatus Binataceae bacterium]|nr:hypothetical protein [Candidatus Binataceae bacterium]